jgi:hypothetical protein
MKTLRIATLLLASFFVENLYCQRIGTLINQDFAFRAVMKDVRGAGLYLHFDDFSEKVEFLMEAGINKRNKLYENDNRYAQSSSYKSFHEEGYFSIKSLAPIISYQKSVYKSGVSLNYILVDTYHTGDAANWTTNRHLSSHSSIGILLNYQYQDFLFSNLNLDMFFIPSYWMLLRNGDPFFEEYSNHFVVSFKVGLSYKLFSSNHQN